jgi:hypothetical protein
MGAVTRLGCAPRTAPSTSLRAGEGGRPRIVFALLRPLGKPFII